MGFAGKVINRSFYYGGSSILGKAIGFVMLPVYTNYLTPEDYGAVGFLILFVSLAQVLLGANLEQAISKYYFDKTHSIPIKTLINTSAIVTILSSMFPFAFSLVFSRDVSRWLFDTDQYHLAVSIASFNIMLGILEIYGLQYFRILDKYKFYLYLNVAKLLTQLASNIVFVVILEYGVPGIMVSSVLGGGLVSAITFASLYKNEKGALFDRKIVKALVLYSAPLWLSGLVGLYTGSVHQVFINYFSSLSDLGLYNLANTFGSLVSVLLLSPFFKYWQVERFKVYNLEERREKIYTRVFSWIVVLGFTFAMLVSVFSRPIIYIMADEAFHGSVAAVAPLSISVVLMYLIWYLNFSFLVTSNNSQIVYNNLIFAGILTASYIATVPVYGFVAAAYSLMVSTFILLHYVLYRSRKYYDMGVSIYLVYVSLVAVFIVEYLSNKALNYISNPFYQLGVLLSGFTVLSIGVAVFVWKGPGKKMLSGLKKFRENEAG